MSTDAEAPPISRRLVLLLAVACGTLVANLYYAQPLLSTIGGSFGVSEGTAGVLVTTAQIGYAVGLAFLVPLGDLVERRRLIVSATVFCAAANTVAVVSPSFSVLAGALIFAGVGASAAMVIVPLSSALSAPQDRGKTVGTVMSGLLVGILLARTVSGFLSELGGWRLVFGFAAVALTVLAAALWRSVPPARPDVDATYGSILRSVVSLIAHLRELRLRMALGALIMAGFSVMWTGLAFLLAGPPFGMNDATIGLFGIAGVAGALAAPLAGKLADRGRGHVAVPGFLSALLASWAFLALGGSSSSVWAIIALIVGIFLLDAGVQGTQVSNQNVVFALDPPARSRLNTAYMVSYFLGGVVGSVAASVGFSVGGWNALCAIGAALALLALAVWFTFRSRTVGRSDSVDRSDAVEPSENLDR
ncbi:MFS transporter [Rhodococcoides trifolii]|uniref:MFS transporter n=1 Tax=Rhodococcoides trifolii TaxID=908250 RepID=A0A917D8S2_9NOCA|nr:MFS transporter [Rhodococcus trifolii]GGG13349.1 MFS transporter [Rhodococcus trifolii]